MTIQSISSIQTAHTVIEEFHKALADYSSEVHAEINDGTRYVLSDELTIIVNPTTYQLTDIYDALKAITAKTGIPYSLSTDE